MKRYRKPYRLKRKRPIWKNRFFRPGILVLILLGGFFYFLFFSEFFQIKKIIVTGEKEVSKEDIKSLVPSKNIFLVNTKEIKKAILDKFPQISAAEIHRGLFDVLNIVVTERVAKAVWCEQDQCFLIDGDGVAFKEAPPETDLIKIFGGKDLVEKEKIGQLLEIQSKLKEKLNIPTTEAFLVSDERVNIKTADGWDVYFNLKGDLDWQIRELSSVLEKEIPPEKRGNLEYIDLRFSRVYYKYKQ